MVPRPPYQKNLATSFVHATSYLSFGTDNWAPLSLGCAFAPHGLLVEFRQPCPIVPPDLLDMDGSGMGRTRRTGGGGSLVQMRCKGAVGAVKAHRGGWHAQGAGGGGGSWCAPSVRGIQTWRFVVCRHCLPQVDAVY